VTGTCVPTPGAPLGAAEVGASAGVEPEPLTGLGPPNQPRASAHAFFRTAVTQSKRHRDAAALPAGSGMTTNKTT
jgi:hypothetical protein